jgi:hypothetical protein
LYGEHEQYRYSWAKAATAAFYLARAAQRFSNLRSGYEVVLPDLERAYAIARDWTSASFESSRCRARPGKLRDQGGEHANWAAVSRVLLESYRNLHTSVN